MPSGNGKFVAAAVVLVGLIGAAIAWKTCQKPPEPIVVVQDAGLPPPKPTGRNPDDDIPLPPPVEDAGSDAGKKTTIVTTTSNGCEAKKCSGTTGTELETQLAFRAKQAHRCYDNALAQDSTLKGKVAIAVRIGNNGQVCSANVASNDMGSPNVANCVAGYFRGASFPPPKGGCVEVNIPINFVPRQ